MTRFSILVYMNKAKLQSVSQKIEKISFCRIGYTFAIELLGIPLTEHRTEKVFTLFIPAGRIAL
jgi:hypothetical protein